MLRITKVNESPSHITMKLEGKIAADWVPLIEDECRRCLKDQRKILLDLSEVTFVDGHGVDMLSKMTKEGIQVVECSALIQYLLEEGKNK